jgi:hypothetical protein
LKSTLVQIWVFRRTIEYIQVLALMRWMVLNARSVVAGVRHCLALIDFLATQTILNGFEEGMFWCRYWPRMIWTPTGLSSASLSLTIATHP